jgi:hypothetical protein
MVKPQRSFVMKPQSRRGVVLAVEVAGVDLVFLAAQHVVADVGRLDVLVIRWAAIS